MPNSRPAVPLLAALVACIALPATFAERASACSVCLAGDPVFEANGASVGEVGQWNLFIQGSGWRKKSAALPHPHAPEHGEEEHAHPTPEEENKSRRLDLYLGYTPVDRVTLTLNVPFAFNQITEIEGVERQRFSLSGLGDVSLMTSVVLWRNRDVLPATWLEGRTFVKAPTGKSHERVHGVKDPHLQPGTGSWDYGFGLAAAHQLRYASLYTSASWRVNTEGSLDYEYGDVALANAAGGSTQNILLRFDRGGRSPGRRLNAADVAAIQTRLAETFREIFVTGLSGAGYQVVEEAGPETLRITAAIVDLYVTAPDTMPPGRVRTYTANSGRMTLVLEVRDSVTGEILARAVDTRTGRASGSWTVTNRGTNTADARRAIGVWASGLRQALDELYGGKA